jgi:hypothetical protein
MNSATSIITHPKVFLPLQPVVAIDFKDLRAKDIVLIRTQNTCYSFVITSEIGMHGRLSSDSQNEFFPEAVLFGSLVKEEEEQRFISRLEPQSHAMFLVQQGNQLVKVITSLITGLCCVRPIA